jgi:hypothetical protein
LIRRLAPHFWLPGDVLARRINQPYSETGGAGLDVESEDTTKRSKRDVRTLLLLVLAVAVAGPALAPPSAAAQASCRGVAALGNHLELAAGRRISIARVRCADARTVVKRFAERCVGAYTSQGSCRFRTRKRWSCASRLVGTAERGAPSAVRCTAGRSRIGFTVRLSETAVEIPPGGLALPGLPFSADFRCIDSAAAGETAPPPAPPNDGFIIHVTGATPVLVAEAIQAELVRRNVGKLLLDGLGVKPRNFPGLVPVFLRKGVSQGVTAFLCGGSASDGIVVEIESTVEEAAKVVTHELFHAHSRGVALPLTYPWFDDAAAEWSTWKAGLMTPPTSWEVNLQYPDTAADTLDPLGYRYGMWRFVQFLDDKGLVVAGGGSWPLIRGTVRGPQLSAALDQQLAARQSSFGQELAAFWGEHLKAKPQRPPRLVPTQANSESVRVTPGRHTKVVTADALHTKLVEFHLAPEVRRVEFEFHPANNSYFWGLVAPNESRRFQLDQAVSFCAGEASGDDLEWPGSFPVTFTNGFLTGTGLQGRVEIFAQTQADQCKPPANRACNVLADSGARPLLGPDLPDIGGFNGSRGVSGGRRYTSCAYKGAGGLATLRIDTWGSSRQLRDWVNRKSRAPGWGSARLGDAGIIFVHPGGNAVFVQLALGRQRLTISVHGFGARSAALRLANEAIPQVR